MVGRRDEIIVTQTKLTNDGFIVFQAPESRIDIRRVPRSSQSSTSWTYCKVNPIISVRVVAR